MINKIVCFFSMPFFNKLNKLIDLRDKLKTRFFYGVFFKKVGKNSVIKSPMFMANVHHIELGNKVMIRNGVRLEVVDIEGAMMVLGDGVSIEQSCHLTSAGELTIDDGTTISANVFVTNIDHEYQKIGVDILKQPYLIKKTYIGKNCFIGLGAAIQAGTILGEQCVVGAHAVVRGEFPDYCVIVGAPARIVKRYNPQTKEWQKTNVKGEFINEI